MKQENKIMKQLKLNEFLITTGFILVFSCMFYLTALIRDSRFSLMASILMLTLSIINSICFFNKKDD